MKHKAAPRPVSNRSVQSLRPPLAQHTSTTPPSLSTDAVRRDRHWTDTVLFGLWLLTLLTPLIYSSTTFFGFITGRTLYFRVLVTLMVALALVNRRFLIQPLTRLQAAVLVYGLVLALADAFGVDPSNSFLSGYSRMEGFLAYAHYSLYFLVLARAGFTKQRWNTALSLSVVVAVGAVVYGASQSSGWQAEHYRLVATLGNPSYLGLYLLLNLFVAVYLVCQFPAVSRLLKSAVLVLVAGVLLWGLARSGTRSAVLGLGAGTAILGLGCATLRSGRLVRRLLVGLTVLLVFGSVMAAVQGTTALKQIPYLQRLTSFSAGEDTFRPRYVNWKMALEGIGDRPFLGWGQENYAYGFAHHYNPALLLDGTETYDRTHNLLIEVGFSAGLIGLLAYGFLWFFLLRQLRINPLFTALDRVTLLAFLTAYVAFNWLNFDSLVSAQLFFLVLSMIDTRLATTPAAATQSVSYRSWSIRLVIIGILLVLGNYTLNAWETLQQIAKQGQAPTNQNRVELLETAYRQARVGQLEAGDLLVSLSTTLINSLDVPTEDKQFAYDRAVAALISERQKHPDNIRLLVRQAGLYMTHKDVNQAAALYDTLLTTDGKRQPQLWFQAGTINLQNQQPDKARQQFQEACRLQPNWQLPIIYEALTHTVKGDTAGARTLMYRITTPILVANWDLIKSVYLMNHDTTGLLTRLDRIRYADRSQYLPTSLYQEWALLAFDMKRRDQVSSALLSFYFAHTDKINKASFSKLVDQARLGVRPVGIEKFMETK